MDEADLKAWLQKGLGRAVLRLRETDARPFRRAVLHACTHNLAYDRQLDCNREIYLLDVIEATGEPGFYRDALLRALTAPGADEDRHQLFAVVRLLAQRGDGEAREALCAAFNRGAGAGDFTGANQLIALDGADGLMVAMAHLARLGSDADVVDADEADPEMWFSQLAERDGDQAAWEAFERAASTFPELRSRLEDDGFGLDEPVRRPPVPGEHYRFDYSELLRLIAVRGSHAAGWLWGWGRHTPEEDLRRAAVDLLAEEEPDRLLAFLRIFFRRAFPLAPDRLIDLARSPDEKIAFAAVKALSNVSHPAVRALALEFADQPGRGADAAELLEANYRPGDEALLERLLDRPMERDAAHDTAFDVLDVVKAHPSEAAVPALLLAYEQTPCVLCRHRAVKLLLALGRLPEWMRMECRWDADTDIRELVAESSPSESDCPV